MAAWRALIGAVIVLLLVLNSESFDPSRSKSRRTIAEVYGVRISGVDNGMNQPVVLWSSSRY